MKTAAWALVVPMLVGCSTSSEATDSSEANLDITTCSADAQKLAAASMISQPIVPNKSVAGVDLHGTLTTASQTLCQPRLKTEGADSLAVWGDADEVRFLYAPESGKITGWFLSPGYRGSLSFKSRPGSAFGEHTYEIAIGRPLLRDGTSWEINFQKRCASAPEAADCFEKQVTEMADGYRFTFAPDRPSAENCIAEFECPSMIGIDEAFVGLDMALSLSFSNITGAQPNTPNMIVGHVLDGSRRE